MNAPAFQFYVADFLLGTATMAADEVGAYIRLLCHQWDKGALPADDQALRRIAGCRPLALAMVRGKFAVGVDGLLRNERLERERTKQAAFREAGAFGGRHGGGNPNFKKGQPNPYYDKAKYKPRLSVKDKASDKAKINIPSPSPSPSPSSSDQSTPAPPSEGVPKPAGKSSKPPKPREPNPLFDALTIACGIALVGITRGAAAQIATALRDIREVEPNLTPDELARRARAYRARYPGAACTPFALAKHWPEFAPAASAQAIAQPWQAECPGWRGLLAGQPIRDPADPRYCDDWAAMSEDGKRWTWEQHQEAKP